MIVSRVVLILLTLALSSCATVKDAVNDSRRIEHDWTDAKKVPYQGSNPFRVVNGHELVANDPNSKKAVLLLISRGPNLSACSGVLIQKNVLLTAAHCVAQAEPKNVRIVFQTRGTAQSSDMKADKIVVHEKFDGEPQNYSDVALVKLPANAPKGYDPVALMDPKEKVSDDSVFLVGYGITSEDKKDSMTLRETKKSFKDDIHLKDGYFGIDQKSATGGFCRGDSGAPILVNVGKSKKLLGINSFTVGLEDGKECHTASVAMPASNFSSWIKANAARL